MKNLFLLIALSAMFYVPAFALNVEVESLSDFSTENPPEIYSVRVVNTVYTKQETIESGSIIEGKVTATDPKRLKRDATFSFVPIKMITPQGKVITANHDIVGKYKKEIDKKKLATSAVLTAGNFVVKGFSTGVTAVAGAVKNEQDNRLKSSAVAVYEASPISYIQKGESLVIKRGQHFYMNFKFDGDDSTEEDNVVSGNEKENINVNEDVDVNDNVEK